MFFAVSSFLAQVVKLFNSQRDLHVRSMGSQRLVALRLDWTPLSSFEALQAKAPGEVDDDFSWISWAFMGFNGVEYIMVIQWTWVSYVGAHLPWCTFGFMGDLTTMTVCSQLISCLHLVVRRHHLAVRRERIVQLRARFCVFNGVVWVQYVETSMFPIMVSKGNDPQMAFY